MNIEEGEPNMPRINAESPTNNLNDLILDFSDITDRIRRDIKVIGEEYHHKNLPNATK